MRRYKLLGHTADTGIVAYGRELSEVFRNAAYAMFDILTDVDNVREVEGVSLNVHASNTGELLVAWLDELLYRYETERMVCSRFTIEDMGDTSLRATAHGEKVDPARHNIKAEIKSVTYHQLKVERLEEGWRAQVIFDV